MGYLAKHQLSYDEQARQTTSPEVLQYIHNMREEHDKLRRDVQHLTEVISSSPVLASQHSTSLSRLRENETSFTPVHVSRLVPVRGHEDPNQHESAPQVPVSDKSLHPQDSQPDLIEELTHSLKGARLHSQGAAQSPSSSGESSPQSQDFPRPAMGDKLPLPQHGAVSSQLTDSHRPNHSATIRQPAHGYGYYSHTDQYRHWDSHYPGDLCRCSPDPVQTDVWHQTPAPLSRPPPAETYHGRKPTIPDLVHDDPCEYARLKFALDNILLDASEYFKFQILTDHLKCEEALLTVDSYNSSTFQFSESTH